MDPSVCIYSVMNNNSFFSGARLRFLNADALVNALANVKEVNELRPQDFNCKFELEHCE